MFTTSSSDPPNREIVLGVEATQERRYWDDAIAFAEAAETHNLTAFCHSAFLANGATNTGTFKGICRGVQDGPYWRQAEDDERAATLWVVPALVNGKAIDAIGIEPISGCWRQLTYAVDMLPPQPAGPWEFTFAKDPKEWLALATHWPRPICFLIATSFEVQQVLLRASFLTSTGNADALLNLRIQAYQQAVQASRPTGRITILNRTASDA